MQVFVETSSHLPRWIDYIGTSLEGRDTRQFTGSMPRIVSSSVANQNGKYKYSQ